MFWIAQVLQPLCCMSAAQAHAEQEVQRDQAVSTTMVQLTRLAWQALPGFQLDRPIVSACKSICRGSITFYWSTGQPGAQPNHCSLRSATTTPLRRSNNRLLPPRTTGRAGAPARG